MMKNCCCSLFSLSLLLLFLIHLVTLAPSDSPSFSSFLRFLVNFFVQIVDAAKNSSGNNRIDFNQDLDSGEDLLERDDNPSGEERLTNKLAGGADTKNGFHFLNRPIHPRFSNFPYFPQPNNASAEEHDEEAEINGNETIEHRGGMLIDLLETNITLNRAGTESNVNITNSMNASLSVNESESDIINSSTVGAYKSKLISFISTLTKSPIPTINGTLELLQI